MLFYIQQIPGQAMLYWHYYQYLRDQWQNTVQIRTTSTNAADLDSHNVQLTAYCGDYPFSIDCSVECGTKQQGDGRLCGHYIHQ